MNMWKGKNRVWVLGLAIAATATVVMAVGCFGGGDADSGSQGGTLPDTGSNGGTVAEVTTTTLVAVIDPLSSFKSKDPFIPQAQVTTTAAPPSTLPPTTAPPTTLPPTTAPPTTAAPTTTIAPGLKVLGFNIGNTAVTFSVNGYTIVHRGGVDDDNVYVGTWGKLKVLEVNFDDPTAPWATFLRDDKYKYEELGLGETRTW